MGHGGVHTICVAGPASYTTHATTGTTGDTTRRDAHIPRYYAGIDETGNEQPLWMRILRQRHTSERARLLFIYATVYSITNRDTIQARGLCVLVNNRCVKSDRRRSEVKRGAEQYQRRKLVYTRK